MGSRSKEFQLDYSTTDTANELVLVPDVKRKKNDGKESNTLKKDATGGKKSRNFALEKDKEKITKKKKRQLAAVQARKAKKLTQDELFASLAEYRLDSETLRQLTSTIHTQDKQTSDKGTTDHLELNALSKNGTPIVTIHRKARIQENYYPTDEEISDNEDDVKVEEKDGNEVEPTYDSIITHCEDALEGDNTKKRKNKKSKIKIIKAADNDNEDETIANAPRKRVCIRREQEDGIIDRDCAVPSTSNEESKHTSDKQGGTRKYISIYRAPEIEEKRSLLPIYGEEVPIVEAINENIVTILCGETGSGKTTQVPQFLYEAGYATDGQIIGITEPRRVAAISMAQRVGEELGLPDAVSYQIRYEGTRSANTKILFMTDGVLMKEMESDIMLKKYSAILIDEAHERSMYSDVLIGMLSRIAPLRAKNGNPLKLIIMSATLRLQDFLHERLFPTIIPKVIKVDARQYPVTVHFEKKTPSNYMAAAFRKTCRIHESLPDGAILIFVSGQQEVHQLIDKLKSRYPIRFEKDKTGENLVRGSKKWKKSRSDNAQEFKLEYFQKDSLQEDINLDGEDLLESGIGNDIWDDYNEEFTDENIDDPLISALPPAPADMAPLYCLPLYSLLSIHKQKKVFEMPPEGARMCVVATNVAETSLTIPGVKYVVDTGFEKQRLYDPITGVSKFVINRLSQASADQRAGRAGRIAAGHAYRLYSSAVFQDLEQFAKPEIMNKPADQLVLHLKSMNIVKVINFPFPSAPDEKSLELAEERLVRMGALSRTSKNGNTEARITSLGKTLAVFPLAPAYGKVIAMANQNGILPYAISLISALSVREPLIPISSLRGSNDEETKALMTEVLKLRRSWCGKGAARRLGDLLVLLKAVAASEESKTDHSVCMKLGLRHKAMEEIRRLRIQLANIITTTFKNSQDVDFSSRLVSISDIQAQMLRQMMVTGLVDCIAKRVDRTETEAEVPRGAYQTTKLKEYVFIDLCSVIYTEEPEYVVYQDIVQLGDKKCMQTLMTVDAEWLPRLAETYCDFSEIKDEEPRYDEYKDEIVRKVSVTFGPLKWKLDPVDKPIAQDIMLYRHFAMFILQGKIMPRLAEYVPKLLAPPTTMIRSWSRLQQRAEVLLNKLIDNEIHTRAGLTKQFYDDENFLLEEYLQWVPESLHPSITLMWPPLAEERKSAKMGRNKIYK